MQYPKWETDENHDNVTYTARRAYEKANWWWAELNKQTNPVLDTLIRHQWLFAFAVLVRWIW